MTLYNAEISAGSLLIPESRRIADLMLSQPSSEAWDAAIVRDNILQKKPTTAKRQSNLIRKRLQNLDAQGLQLIVQSDVELCGQLLMAAALRHSQLMADFMRDVYAVDLRQLERKLSHRQWDTFLTECAHRDDGVNTWATSTRLKLFQVIVRILVEAKFLDSTKNMQLTPPMLHPRLHTYLSQLGARDTLVRMEFGQ
ncbi:DUF1819 domain-containing protein [Limnohabitans sp. TS-CS-82]|uniref:DUF1819 family protein n=1 Tax=Limnohabitans sp. TS-CS-82 TaxID=2094193 RepID=UPI000CF1E28A|nr:DUF1819 family protein [Limnohabitans sp. TS-CS-82]PQA81936.1 DUF1819 domain-containing protein [Limnohabitans sp. TS-CS-82]